MTKAVLIRGKTIKDWSKYLNLSIARVYQLHKKNQLESKIDGTWSPTEKVFQKYFGKTVTQWSKELNITKQRVRLLIKIEKFQHVIKTGDVNVRKPTGRLIKGKNLAQWAKVLGITRERARQLANQKLLLKRINAIE